MTRSAILLAVVLILPWTIPRAAHAGPDFPAIIARLGHEDYDVRQRALARLVAALANDELNASELLLLYHTSLGLPGTPGDGNLEAAHWAELLVRQFVFRDAAEALPSVTAILALVGAHLDQPQVIVDDVTHVVVDRVYHGVVFGPARGRPDPPPASNPTVSTILDFTATIARALAAGDTDSAQAVLQQLKAFIEALGDDEWSALNLRRDGAPYSRADALRSIDLALGLLPQARTEYETVIVPLPGPWTPRNVTTPDEIGGLDSFTVEVEFVTNPGTIEITSSIDRHDAIAPPPGGWEFVGPVYAADAGNGLAIGGVVTITIEYGPDVRYGNGLAHPADLALVRIADGRARFLPAVITPVAVEGSYTVEDGAGGASALGTFALVQPACPELRIVEPGAAPAQRALEIVREILADPAFLRERVEFGAWGATTSCPDHDAPVVVAPPDVTLPCDLPPDIVITGVATAADSGDPAPTVEFVDAPSPSEPVIVRVWRATDVAGNPSSTVQVIDYDDDEPPTIVCPPDVIVTCGEPVDPVFTGEASAADDCDPAPTVTYQDVDAGGCGGVITRVWTATDQAGNESSCVQLIFLAG